MGCGSSRCASDILSAVSLRPGELASHVAKTAAARSSSKDKLRVHPTDDHTQSGDQQEQIKAVWNANGEKELVLLHFNDVYNIEPREQEPVGGAARFVTKVRQFQSENPLVFFSGDAFSPSIMSTITEGKQMVPVLNALNIHTACVGNHDLDFGIPVMDKLLEQIDFPWLCSNVIDKSTGRPLGNSPKTRLFTHVGIKIGIIGLVEEEWICTLGTVDPSQLEFTDFVECGRQLGKELRQAGAEVVIALTHMRVPNDTRLGEECPEVDIILGGHDHHYEVIETKAHGTTVFKSGTDFRDLTYIKMLVGNGRPRVQWERLAVTSDVPEDPEVKEVVDHYLKVVGNKMEEQVGVTWEPLDARFSIIRTQESNIGNMITDIWREYTGCDIVLLNSGTIRSDQIHPKGMLKVKDLVAMVPMIDETVTLEMDGASVILALENGVSQYPKLEGRFPQVSGITFEFDPSKPSGARVVEESVKIAGKPLNQNKLYSLCTKEYLAKGKDGYDVFARCRQSCGPNESPIIPTMIRNHFDKLKRMTSNGGALDDATQAYKQAADEVQDDSTTSYLAVWSESLKAYAVCPRVEGRIKPVSAA